MISSPNSTASAEKETSTLGRDRKVSLRVVQEGAWGRGGPSRLQTGSAEPQESPIEGGPGTSTWLHVEHSCRAGSPHAPRSQVEGAQ